MRYSTPLTARFLPRKLVMYAGNRLATSPVMTSMFERRLSGSTTRPFYEHVRHESELDELAHFSPCVRAASDCGAVGFDDKKFGPVEFLGTDGKVYAQITLEHEPGY